MLPYPTTRVGVYRVCLHNVEAIEPLSKRPSQREGANQLAGVVAMERVATLEGELYEWQSVYDTFQWSVDHEVQYLGILRNTNARLHNAAPDSSSVVWHSANNAAEEEKFRRDAKGGKEALLDTEARKDQVMKYITASDFQLPEMTRNFADTTRATSVLLKNMSVLDVRFVDANMVATGL